MAYQLEKKALKKVNTISATDYIALINNVEKQKNAGNVLITWSDFLAEVGMDLNYIQNLSVQNLVSSNASVSNLEVNNSVTMTQVPANITGPAAVPLTNMVVFLNNPAPVAYTLAAGTLGQYVTLILRNKVLVGDFATITAAPSPLRGFSSINLNDIGDAVTLWYDGAMWNIVSQVANAVPNP